MGYRSGSVSLRGWFLESRILLVGRRIAEVWPVWVV